MIACIPCNDALGSVRTEAATTEDAMATNEASALTMILRCRTCKATARVNSTDPNGRDVADAAFALLAAHGGSPMFGASRSLPNLFCCGRRVVQTFVRGTMKPEHKCDGRCLASHGPVCECACGGKNHGASYAA